MAQRQWRSDDTDKWTDGFGNGSDGAYAPSTGTRTEIDSACTATIDTNSVSATNVNFATGQTILIHQTKGTGAGQWELNKISSYTAGTITTKYKTIYAYVTGAQVMVISQYTSALVDTGVTLTGKAYDGTVGGILGWFCKGETTITGSLTIKGANGVAATGVGQVAYAANGGGFRGGYSQDGNAGTGQQGENTANSQSESAAASANGGGAGGGNGYNVGGGGGNGTAGANATGSTTSNGLGGATSGNAALTSMSLGGGAGGARGSNGVGIHESGANGGGIILLISKTITITGSIIADGGLTNDKRIEGGGGAGGSVLLKGKDLTLGTALITALGGVGGNGTENAGDGGVGRIHADYSTSLTGTTNPTIDSTLDSTISEGGSGFFMAAL
jgi:hypothetical protein